MRKWILIVALGTGLGFTWWVFGGSRRSAEPLPERDAGGDVPRDPFLDPDPIAPPEVIRQLVVIELETRRDPESIRIQGSVVFKDSDGILHRRKDGILEVYVRSGNEAGSKHTTVAIRDGCWSMEVPSGHSIEFTQLQTDERLAQIVNEGPFEFESDAFLELHARIPRATILKVVDDRGLDLQGVIVRYSPDGAASNWADLLELPLQALVVKCDVASPFELEPLDGVFDIWQGSFSVSASGYATKLITLDFAEGGTTVVALPPAGGLEVILLNYLPPPAPSREKLREIEEILQEAGRRFLVNALEGIQGFQPSRAPVIKIWEDESLKVDPEASDLQSTLQETDPLVREARPKSDGTYRCSDLESGRYQISVVIDEIPTLGSVVLGASEAEIFSGETTTVTIALDPIPQVQPLPTVSGTLFVPPEWQYEWLGIGFEPTGQVGGVPGRGVHPKLSGEPSSPSGIYSWSIQDMYPGTYEVIIEPFGFRDVIEVRRGFESGIELRVPAPADVVIRFMDDRGRVAGSVKRMLWQSTGSLQSSGPSQSRALQRFGGSAENRVRDGVARFQAPVGEIQVQVEAVGFAEHEEATVLVVGKNEITLILESLPGVSLKYDHDRMPSHLWINDTELREIGGDGRLVHWVEEPSMGVTWLGASKPGQYELHIGSLEGYEPFENRIVDLSNDGTVEIPLEFTPLKDKFAEDDG